MCLTYESVHNFAEERIISAELVPLAPEYERVHFIGHALYNPSISEEDLQAQAATIQAQLQNQSGYKVFLVTIMVKQYPPFTTDVDFVLDVPVESPIAPLAIIAIIVALAAILAWIVWLFWTTYVEKIKTYYCDQETPPTAFEGWLQYVAHLAEKHPIKYQAIQESKSKDWWAEWPTMIKWLVGGTVAVAAVTLIIALVPRERR